MKFCTVPVFPLAIAMVVSGCAVGPDFQAPAAPNTDSYLAVPLPLKTEAAPVLAGEAQHFVPGEQIPLKWWQEFGSPALNEVVQAALLANPDLAAAKAALRVARESAAAQRGAFWPSVAAQWHSGRGREAEADSLPLTLHAGQLDISYSLDAFGSNSRQLEASLAEVEVQQFQREAVYMTLVSNIVNAAIQEASLRAQIAATQEQIRLASALLELNQREYRAGQIGGADLLSQEAALAQAELALPPLERQLAEQRHLLAALAGRLPSEPMVQQFELASLKLPRQLPLSLPSRLVEQRPDVRAAQAQLHAASAQIGIAKAARLPSFTLTASVGRFGDKVSGLTRAGGAFWSLGGGVLQPIFDGGALKHQQHAAEAAYDEAQARYRSVVLTAFQNTADTLQAVVSDAKVLRAASTAQVSAEKNLAVARRQRALGAASQSDLILAQQAIQEATLAMIQVQASRYTNTVALYQALGGWWEAGQSDLELVE